VADLTSLEILAITIVVVLAVVGAGLGFLLARRLRQRKAQLLHELTDRPQLMQDRAFNRLGMARREAELLSRQGADTARARELIAQSQASYDTKRYDDAYRTAQMAHESLVDARRGGRLPDLPPASAGSMAVPPILPATPASSSPSPPAPATPAIPRNRAESQFQLRLLDQELEARGKTRSRGPAATEAKELSVRSHAAFDRGDFTEAFRWALKGRRALGGTIEALPPSPGTRTEGAPLAPSSAAGTVPADAATTAERVAGGDHCAECGYPALPGDAFCRGCGTPRTPTVCPQCGATRAPTDTFCGRCGHRYS
jgi:hypothetical protein